jgi:hypothetical protein
MLASVSHFLPFANFEQNPFKSISRKKDAKLLNVPKGGRQAEKDRRKIK